MRKLLSTAAAVALLAATPAFAQQSKVGSPTPEYGVPVLTDCSGVLCWYTGGGSGGSLSAKANAADQTSSEGNTTDPLSMDLSRYLRVIAKQTGSWNIVNISGTISLPTGASTSAAQTTAQTSFTSIDGKLTGVASAANQTAVQGSAGGTTFVKNALYDAASGAAVSLADLHPTAGTITAVDAASTTVSGQGGVTLVTGSPTANSFVTQAIDGYASGNVTVTGTFVGTVQVESSADGGTTWFPSTGLLRGTSTLTGTLTGPAVVSLETAGVTNLRVRATAYTSGTVGVKFSFGGGTGGVKVLNSVTTSATSAGLGSPAATFPAQALAGGCRGSTTQPTAVTDGQLVGVRCDEYGDLISWLYAHPSNYTTGLITTAMTGTTSTALTGMGAPGAGLRNYVTEISCHNTHATVDTLVNIQDGSGGTVIAQLFTTHVGGHEKPFTGAPLRQPTTNTGLFAVDVTTGASVTCSASGFKAP